MKSIRKYNKATSVIEYSLMIAIAVGALLAMSIYIKRAICGRWRQVGDTFGYGRQYKAPEVKLWEK
ncbi:MAG: hypothetical protein PHE18_07895 [Candidatus Omnitrophica bacterium]|nr:hypothetical protein [Candidatus Omnitrophota bacterium]MDD5553774.1 hypothetical protein [Candidatus Omnitrophota bacterium]